MKEIGKQKPANYPNFEKKEKICTALQKTNTQNLYFISEVFVFNFPGDEHKAQSIT